MDRDTGNNSALVYSIVGGDDWEKFHIDSNRGNIFSKFKVTGNEVDMYSIVVEARDDWGRGLVTSTIVKVCDGRGGGGGHMFKGGAIGNL